MQRWDYFSEAKSFEKSMEGAPEFGTPCPQEIQGREGTFNALKSIAFTTNKLLQKVFQNGTSGYIHVDLFVSRLH